MTTTCAKLKMEKKTEPTNFVCKFPGCTLSYSRQWKLDRHWFSHTGERPFRCETAGCEKTYQSKSHLQRHVRSAHTVEYLLPCMFQSCKETFKNKQALMKHIKYHGRSKQFQCSVCLKFFVTEKRLTTHQLTHMGVLPYSCQICKSHWPSGTLLRRHMTAHQALPCQYQACAEIFNSRQDLRKHLAVEHRQGYSCDHCKKSFNNKGILRDHVLIHLPSEARGVIHCPHAPCKRVYYQKRNLTHHIKVFHNTARFYCPVDDCGKTCITEESLKRHFLQRHHLKKKAEKLQIIQNLANIASIVDNEPVETVDQPAQYEFRVTSRDHLWTV